MKFDLHLTAATPISSLESDDAYQPVVTRLNERWRVIVCRGHIQWILQYRASKETAPGAGWRGRSYCRSREALLRDVGYRAGEIGPGAIAMIEALPPVVGNGGEK